jgi:hypothetical protein
MARSGGRAYRVAFGVVLVFLRSKKRVCFRIFQAQKAARLEGTYPLN